MRRLAFALALAGCSQQPELPKPRYEVAVISALPLFWSEADATKALSQGDERAPIIRKLAETFTMTPIDLADEKTLRHHRLLLLAQPAALGGAELVAIDAWVRAGGRLLVFADPALTWPSPYALGDPRAAPRITMLNPLLTHWGLQLISPAISSLSADGEMTDAIVSGDIVTVSAAGQWRSASKVCEIVDRGLRATCRLGKGRVELVADADLLDLETLGAVGRKNGAAVASLLQNLSNGLPTKLLGESESRKEQEKNKVDQLPQSDRLSRQQE